MAGVYRPRHPERTVLYRVLFHHFDRFLTEYEARFERGYGFFRPIIKEVVERYLDCGNPASMSIAWYGPRRNRRPSGWENT
jgi:hypothetical protein